MNEIIFLTPDLSSDLPLPFADGGIPAGFPSPAQDYVDGILDLNKELIKHPAATFYAKVVGDSMNPGINEGDLLVVDRSLEAFDDCIAVCCLNNEFTIKRIDLSHKGDGYIRLVPDNPKYEPIVVKEDDNFILWGVVRYVIHKTV
ncbi:MAG: translesion error-prone DNA polymerase V autoproteolytic subunit [Bacteroidaceae bacterium]|nr:translesion error-prone DNA polymerase V autoproteolytic subunit [Bacteroidaceae bacterium]